MTKRVKIVTLLLLFAWPCLVIHRFWNNQPVNKLSLFLGTSIEQDIQWYICDTGMMLYYLLILYGLYLKDKWKLQHPNITLVLKAVLITRVIDVFHYWIWFRQNEYVVMVEGFIMAYCYCKILFKNGYKSNDGTTT